MDGLCWTPPAVAEYALAGHPQQPHHRGRWPAIFLAESTNNDINQAVRHDDDLADGAGA